MSSLDPRFDRDMPTTRFTRRELLCDIYEDGNTCHKVLIEFWYAEVDGTVEMEKPVITSFIPDSLTEDLLTCIKSDLKARRINLTII